MDETILRYYCAHCLRDLVQEPQGVLHPCPEHPDGAVTWEIVESADAV